MAGLIQIANFLLCVYLVFKGVEILQIALMSTSEHRKLGITLGWTMVIAAVVIGAIGFLLTIAQGSAMQPDLPRR
jgi:hypothetical protein